MAASFKISPAESLVPSARSVEREYEPTPFDDTISSAANDAVFEVGVKSAEQAKEALSLLNKSARHFKRYLRIRYIGADRSPVKRGSEDVRTVQFQVRDEPARQVSYSADDIRAWAEESGLPTTGGGKTGKAIPAETRAAFWDAVRAEQSEQETADA